MMRPLLIVVALSALGCRGSVDVIVPAGYSGPVVLVWDDPKGIDASRSDWFSLGDQYRIEVPLDGIAFIEEPMPRVWEERVWEPAGDGSLEEIPPTSSPISVERRTFLGWTGGRGIIKQVSPTRQEDGGTIGYSAFVVGVPVAHGENGWRLLREQAVTKALDKALKHRGLTWCDIDRNCCDKQSASCSRPQ